MFWAIAHGAHRHAAASRSNTRAPTPRRSIAARRRARAGRDRAVDPPVRVPRGPLPAAAARRQRRCRLRAGAGRDASRARSRSLAGKKIGVPGLRTSAYLVLRLLLPEFEPVIVPVAPFRRAYEALRSGEVDAALADPRGPPAVRARGLRRASASWARRGTRAPACRCRSAATRSRARSGAERIALVSRVLRESIRWALEHRDEVLSSLLAVEDREGVPRDRALFDRYLSMYANQDTLDYGARRPPRDRRAAAPGPRRRHHPARAARRVRAVAYARAPRVQRRRLDRRRGVVVDDADRALSRGAR